MTELSQSIRIMLVDDHQLFRDGVASLLKRDGRFEIIHEANNGAEALECIQKNIPDIVLMDIQMPDMGGIETTRKMLAFHPDLKVVMITISEKAHDLFEAIKAGAQGYILKTDTDCDAMCEAIASVAAGEAIIPPGMAPRLLTEFASLAQNQTSQGREDSSELIEPTGKTSDSTERNEGENSDIKGQHKASLLTPREYQVLELVAQGLTNKGIGTRLDISENTVRSHLRSILDKLHMNNRVQAAMWLQGQKSD